MNVAKHVHYSTIDLTFAYEGYVVGVKSVAMAGKGLTFTFSVYFLYCLNLLQPACMVFTKTINICVHMCPYCFNKLC